MKYRRLSNAHLEQLEQRSGAAVVHLRLAIAQCDRLLVSLKRPVVNATLDRHAWQVERSLADKLVDVLEES